ncbi:MAG: hypothetical protein AAFU85_06545 [Planctomycetota bacterium]
MSESSRPSWAAISVAAVAVATASIAIRWSSCQDSFWLDELHSVWAVSGTFSEVVDRASVGNQTTGYFHFLWCWARCFGFGEVAMRMSSVLATALASGLLVLGVASQTRRLSAGVIAGGILALDPNAIFFGTELRPYALVMVCSVLATSASMMWLSEDLTGRSLGGARYRLAMLFWICVAALIHPTSLGVLFWLLPLSVLVAWYRGRLTLWRADWVAVLVVVATLGLLAMSSLPNSWAKREQWKAFGQATDWRQVFVAWDWIPIIAVPLGVSALGLLFFALRPKTEDGERDSIVGLVPLLAGILGTVVFFAASYFDIVPLWKRRYFIAALPLLAWSAGVAGTLFTPRRGWVPAGLVIVLGFHLTYLTKIQKQPWPRQRRSEPWREVVSMVDRQAGELVWVDTGLIEASFFYEPVDERPLIEPDWEYLAFPVRGSYRLDNVTVVAAGEHPSWLEFHARSVSDDVGGIWFVGRTSPAAADRLFGFLGQRLSMQVVEAKQIGVLVLVHAVRRGAPPENSVAFSRPQR